MKKILLGIAIGTLGAWSIAAQTTASNQASAATQSHAAMQSNNAGLQSSQSGSAAASSTSSVANASNTSAMIAAGTKIDATLATSLDAKRSKPGDDVEARTEEDIKQDGRVVLKRGTHLVGHVTQAQARANGQTHSELGIVFDRAVLKNGQTVPFSASIQAVASADLPSTGAADAGDNSAISGMGATQASARGGANHVNGMASTAVATSGPATANVMNTASPISSTTGGALNTAVRSSGAVGGLNSMGRLSSNSTGVFGLDGLSIDFAATNAAQGSTIVSATKNVHLDSGTQFLLRTAGQAQ